MSINVRILVSAAVAACCLVLTILRADEQQTPTSPAGQRDADAAEKPFVVQHLDGDIQISGTAIGTEGDAIEGMSVSVIRNGAVIAGDATGDEGGYDISVPAGGQINLRFLKQPSHDPAVIFALSGRHNQNVSQVIYRDGEERDESADFATKRAEQYLQDFNLD